ncbi:MAG TPA: hypothetical protein VFE47_17905 [Tepidisphaeraceae bacterium]|jgi:hypothetical protein|nr:hypothetical protein [Tepidisphaeraceae bacterium]
MNKKVRSTLIAGSIFALLAGGCDLFDPKPSPYGVEKQLFLPGVKRQVWAISPVINLSGQKTVDPVLQADLVYQQMQQVHGLTLLPVNRVVEVMAGLKMEKVQSADQAAVICDLLGCDALVVPTVTIYDPYDPPKLGASLQLFAKPAGFTRPKNVDVRELSRAAAPVEDDSLPAPDKGFLQAVGMYDASNGTVRDAVVEYARGRQDPLGPLGTKEYLESMDRYCGFVYNALTAELLKQMDGGMKPQVASAREKKKRGTKN